MITIAFDTETERFGPGRMAPPLVCLQWFQTGDPEPSIVNRWDAKALLEVWLRDPHVLLVGQNVAYDIAVCMAAFPDQMPLWFAALDANRVTDTMLREQLIDTAKGRLRGGMVKGKWVKRLYNLGDLAYRHTKWRLNKQDPWRERYGELIDTPVSEWPGEALEYALLDGIATYDVWASQEGDADLLGNQYVQTRHSVWRHLMSVHGIKASPQGVGELARATQERIEQLRATLSGTGLIRKDGTRDLKRAAALMESVCLAAGIEVRRNEPTEKMLEKDPNALGSVQLDADACEATEDDTLEAYAEHTKLVAVQGKDVPMLAAAVNLPVHARWGIAASWRTTCSSPNWQNLRTLPGIRECIIPREGRVFIQSDYEQLELFTLAQACFTLFGHSRLRELLNTGMDPHTDVACQILKIPYAEGLVRKKSGMERDLAFYKARQTAKVANFGFPGGLGPRKLVKFAYAQYDVVIDEDWVRSELKPTWLATFPEMQDYFAYINALPEGADGMRTVEQLFVNRLRGGCTYCGACNTIFQGLGADVAQAAGWAICKAMYNTPASPLFGSRLVNFIHDEFLGESREDVAPEAAEEMARLMVREAEILLPDMKPRTEPSIMRYWSKKAETMRDAKGRLLVWG